jgi:hypothetical protein
MRLDEVRRGYHCFLLTREARAGLLERYPPRFPDVLADHVTIQIGVLESDPLPEPARVVVQGYAGDPEGIEALVVSVNGTTSRPDGSAYHCTWSLDRSKGFEPVHSNELIMNFGWAALAEPIPVATVVAFRPSSS